jgi:CheY-like chemotaxis protein
LSIQRPPADPWSESKFPTMHYPNILIVENSPRDAELLKDLLVAARILNPTFVVLGAVSAECYLAGTGMYHQRDIYPLPGILFVDLRMPDLDGRQFIEWARKKPECQKILLIAISENFELSSSAQEASQLGADAVFRKPCKLEDIESLLRNFPEHWAGSYERAHG